MSDLERLISDSLRNAGESYEPSDQVEARRRFLERARRRRWFGIAQVATATGLAVAAVIFFAGPVTEPEPAPPQDLAGAPKVVARIGVGGEPRSVGAEPGGIWVADAGGDGLVAIDPEMNEVETSISLGAGTPDEVVVGDSFVWVADQDGNVHQVDPARGRFEKTFPDFSVGLPAHLDLAVHSGHVWVVEPARGEVNVGINLDATGEFDDSGFASVVHFELHPTDVAAGGEGVWMLDGPGGELQEFDLAGATGRSIELPAGEHSDLTVGLGYVWVSPGQGSVYRVDPETHEVDRISVADSYTDLTTDGESLWVLAEGDTDRLLEIDPVTAEVVGEPLEIEGEPSDLITGSGAVWVTDAGEGEVLRIERSSDADEAPPPTPDEAAPTPDDEATPAPVEDVVFVYSEDGDLFAETREGGSIQLTDTVEIEENPSISSDGRFVVFERHGDGEDELVEMDLRKRWECCIRGGATGPAIAAGGEQVGWVHPASGRRQAEIAIGGLGTKGYNSWPVSEFEEPMRVRHLVFDHTNQYLAYEAGYEGSSLFIAPLSVDAGATITEMGAPAPVVPANSDAGAAYKAVSGATELNVVKVCCGSTHIGGFESAEFGEITLAPDNSYTGLQDLSDLGLDLDSEELFTSYLGGMTPTVDDAGIEWATGDNETWLVGDGTSLWVIEPATEGATELPMSADGGAAAPNELALNPLVGAD
ncbi:MAG: hypothetical protein ACRDLB_02515 [Actinomycetota bacterium]